MSEQSLANLDHPLSSSREIGGEWVDIAPARFLVRPLNGRNRAFRVFGAQHQTITETNLHELLSTACVMDWDGIVVDGAPLKYSEARARELFSLHPALADAVLEAAQLIGDEDERRYQEDAAVIKKSPPTKGNGQARSTT